MDLREQQKLFFSSGSRASYQYNILVNKLRVSFDNNEIAVHYSATTCCGLIRYMYDRGIWNQYRLCWFERIHAVIYSNILRGVVGPFTIQILSLMSGWVGNKNNNNSKGIIFKLIIVLQVQKSLKNIQFVLSWNYTHNCFM